MRARKRSAREIAAALAAEEKSLIEARAAALVKVMDAAEAVHRSEVAADERAQQLRRRGKERKKALDARAHQSIAAIRERVATEKSRLDAQLAEGLEAGKRAVRRARVAAGEAVAAAVALEGSQDAVVARTGGDSVRVLAWVRAAERAAAEAARPGGEAGSVAAPQAEVAEGGNIAGGGSAGPGDAAEDVGAVQESRPRW
ncbi:MULTISPECIES: hypothetical protein [unclassified Crossiella]|uniref:hypothetical protein n=1 Tax=unclassified Crossiella TaxID=2620835 RepID=UPI0020004972|nr:MULTISPECIES: hypothetical protein [unclassified Crossiella]MCK2239993.1 hypothetical protein [Crossiella sp. S99.2]MCK2252701.1 hypothetical protein [Crossiella sp. S99.1]